MFGWFKNWGGKVIDNFKSAAETDPRMEAIKQRRMAYEGDMPKPLNTTDENGQPIPDDNVIAGLPGFTVDTGVDALFGECPAFEVFKPNTQRKAQNQRTAEEIYLEQVFKWEGNNLPLLLHRSAVTGGYSGHVAWKIIPSNASDGDAAYPRIVNLDPETFWLTTDPHDQTKLLAVRIEYEVDNRDKAKYNGKNYRFRQMIERAVSGTTDTDGNAVYWTIQDFEKPPQAKEFVPVGELVSWPFPFAPVVHCQNLPSNHVYGYSDLEKAVYDLCHNINRDLSLINRILRLAGYPRDWISGVTRDQWLKNRPRSVEEMLVLTGDNAKAGTLELRNDLGAQLNTLEKHLSLFHQLTSIPEIVSGKLDKLGVLSGVALKVLYAPLTKKTNKKRLTYGGLIAETMVRILIIEQQKAREELEVNLIWAEVVPSNDKEEAETALLDQQLGASKDTLLRKRGYDPDNERAKREVDETDLGEALLRGMNAPPETTNEET